MALLVAGWLMVATVTVLFLGVTPSDPPCILSGAIGSEPMDPPTDQAARRRRARDLSGRAHSPPCARRALKAVC